MIKLVSVSDTQGQRVKRDGRPAMKLTNYLGKFDEIERGPQAFLVEGGDDAALDPHFHGVDQFQIFTRGGRIGKISLGVTTVHYTDSFTPYGPITPASDGLKFFNLRGRADVGAHYMPGSRSEMPRHAGRHRTVGLDAVDLDSIERARRLVMIDPEDDGLLAYETVAGPGQQLPDDVAGGAGRYELVLRGSLVVDGKRLLAESILYASAGERLPARQSGPEGVQVLTLQVPSD